MNWRLTLVGTHLLLALAPACGDPFTLVGAGGSAVTTTIDAGGAPAQGGAGGRMEEEAGPAPECMPGALSACGEGRYCQRDTEACAPCADLTRLHFAPPRAISLTPSTKGTTAHYPRADTAGETLYFVYVDDTGALPRSRLASLPFQPRKGGPGAWTLMSPPIASPMEEGAPLPLSTGTLLAGLVDTTAVDTADPVLLFDSTRNGAATRKVFAANPGHPTASIVSLPSGKRDADIAAAPLATPPRFYWMSDGLGSQTPRLVTATGASAQMSPVTLALDSGCVIDAVVGPWITPSGALLLFGANAPLPGSCAPVTPSHQRIYAARMGEDGKQAPSTTATPLFPDDEASFDSTPSLSPDACFLFFARFDPATTEGRLMLSPRD